MIPCALLAAVVMSPPVPIAGSGPVIDVAFLSVLHPRRIEVPADRFHAAGDRYVLVFSPKTAKRASDLLRETLVKRGWRRDALTTKKSGPEVVYFSKHHQMIECGPLAKGFLVGAKQPPRPGEFAVLVSR